MFTHITLNRSPGTLHTMFSQAHRIAVQTKLRVSFKFNDVTVNITELSTLNTILADYDEASANNRKAIFGEGWI